MRTCILSIVVLLANVPLCSGEINTDLSHFIYAIPVMEGTEWIGTPEEQKWTVGKGIEGAVVIKVLSSKKGVNLSAEQISKYYRDHFVSRKFRPWPKESVLSGTYNAPDLVTKGNAYIRSQGHIQVWIPPDGNSITFCLYQRREFDVRECQGTIDKISKAFEAAAQEFGYTARMPANVTSSDWPEYLENECFVDRTFLSVRYKETDVTSERGDDGSFRFYLSVFPTAAHAGQWRDKIVEQVAKRKPYPNWFQDGLGFSPTVVENIVVEYKGESRDRSDPAFRKRLVEELKTVQGSAISPPG